MKKRLSLLQRKTQRAKKNRWRTTWWQKGIALWVILAFLGYSEPCLLAQSNDEIQSQFQRAADSYKKGQKVNALKRLEGIVGLILEKNMDLKEILGKSYLLMGAIYEKEAVNDLALANYKRAVEQYHVNRMPGIDFSGLPLYKKHVAPKIIEQQGVRKAKKFPWLVVAASVAVSGVLLYMMIKKNKKYTLTVNMAAGVEGVPVAGNHSYRKGESVPYSFSTQDGYGNLTVLLDEVVAAPTGAVTMNKNHTLTVRVDDAGFVTSQSQVSIVEGGSASFTLCLTARPQTAIVAEVSPAGGATDDADIRVVNGPNFTFTPDNWATPQTVTLAAAEDDDFFNGSATIRIHEPAGKLRDTFIIAKELDNDAPGFQLDVDEVNMQENGTGPLRVRLVAAPATDVTVTISRMGEESTVSIQSPPEGKLVFTPLNWHEYQTITFYAAHDADANPAVSTFRLSAPDMPDRDFQVKVSDDESLALVIPMDKWDIPEGGKLVVPIKLSAKPDVPITLSIERISGSTSIGFAPQSITFDPANHDVAQELTLTAAEDDNAQNEACVIRISAPFLPFKEYPANVLDNDLFRFITDQETIALAEEGTATFQVTLSAQPTDTLHATVTRSSGDSDIYVATGQTLTFTTADWMNPQTVTLGAVKDEDKAEEPNKNGVARISIAAPPVEPKEITATEIDNGPSYPPDVYITRPENGDTITDDFTIIVMPYDAFGIRKVELYLDNILVKTMESSPYNYVWSTANVPEGLHTITAVAFDWANQSEVDTHTVTLYDSLPIVTALRTATGTSPLSGNITVNIAAKDFTGVQSVRFYVDDMHVSSWNSGPAKEVIYYAPLNTTQYNNGAHIFKAVAVDTAGRESVPVVLSVTIIN